MNIEAIRELAETGCAKIKALSDELRSQCRKQFSEISKEVFSANPKLESFSWTQYTPYFNDGDECVFRANKDDLKFVWDGKEYEDVGEWNLTHEKYSLDYPEEARPVFSMILELMEAIPKESLKDIFGDHCEVVVSRTGAVAEEYSHD